VRSASGRGGAARRRDSRAAAAAASPVGGASRAVRRDAGLPEEARRPFKGAMTAAAGTSPGARP